MPQLEISHAFVNRLRVKVRLAARARCHAVIPHASALTAAPSTLLRVAQASLTRLNHRPVVISIDRATLHVREPLVLVMQDPTAKCVPGPPRCRALRIFALCADFDLTRRWCTCLPDTPRLPQPCPASAPAARLTMGLRTALATA